MDINITSPNLPVVQERFQRAPRVAADLIEKNLRSLGKVIAAKERRVLDAVKYRGTLARSVSTQYEARPPVFQITIGPAAPEGDKHAYYVFFGTKPHWPPEGPIREWVKWKFGGAKLITVRHKAPGGIGPTKQTKVKKAATESELDRMTFLVRRSIARHGTSVGIERRGLGDGHGGYNYVARTLASGYVQQGIARTAQRIPLDVKTFFDTGQPPSVASSGGET